MRAAPAVIAAMLFFISILIDIGNACSRVLLFRLRVLLAGRTALLAIDHRHHVLGVALTCRGVEGEDFIEAGEVILRELDVSGRGILLQIFSALRAGDRHDIVALRQSPRQSELSGRAFFLDGEFLHFMDEVEIFLEVLSLKARRVATVIVSGEIFVALELSRKKSAAERAVSDEADAELAAGFEDSVGFRIARPERIFGLQGGDGMNFDGTPKSVGTGLGQAEVADLSIFYELRHRSHRVFDGRIGIDAMLVIKVDGFDAEAAEAGFTGFANVFGLAAHSAGAGIAGVANDAEFCGDDVFVAHALDGAPDEFLVFVRAVDIGRVEEVDPQLESAVDGGDGFRVIPRAVEFRHTHTAKAQGGDFETGVAKKTLLHDGSLLSV